MSKELLSSKIIVVEEEPKVRSIQASPTSVLGAIGIAERGPIDKAVFCTSFEEYEQNFGGFTQNSDLALGAMGFFENGGSQLWVVRIAHHTDIDDPESITALRAFGYLTVETPPSMAEATSKAAVTKAVDPDPVKVLRVEGKDPGAYANRIEVEVRLSTSGETDAFDLAVVEDGVYRELFPDIKMDSTSVRYVETIVNDERNGSDLIRVIDQHEDAGIPDVQTASLAGGDDGLDDLDDTDFIGSEAGKTGLYAFDRVQDLSLLIVPGRATPAVHNTMLRYCEVTRDGMVFAVLDSPEGTSAADIVEYVQNEASLQELSEFGAIYWPRVQVLNPSKSVFGSAEKIVVPPSGIITGVFARTDAARPGGVYDPPAGIENGRMFGVLGFETDEVLEEAKRDLIYPKRINPLTTGTGLPRFIDGSRTLKSNGNFPYVAERRGVIFIEKSLKQGLQFARHKTNTENLRAQVRRTITAFLLIQMNNGAFQSKEPAKAFFVDVSETLNTPSVIFAGKLIARIGLATNKPAEFILLMISQDTRALDAELAAAGV